MHVPCFRVHSQIENSFLNVDPTFKSWYLDPWLLFLSKHSIKIRNTCNLPTLEKSWNEFNFFQTRKIDLWKKRRPAIEIIDTEVLRKELEEINIWIGNNIPSRLDFSVLNVVRHPLISFEVRFLLQDGYYLKWILFKNLLKHFSKT